MKKMRKIVVLLAVMMAATVIGGCGKSFDAGAYIKALLDNSYKNDSTAFVEQKVGTKEQAEELYNQGIDTELSSITASAQLSDSLKEEFRNVLEDVFKSVKYTVGEAVKDGDSYTVEVKYQKMKIFAPAMESYAESYGAYYDELTEKAENGEEVPSDEELNEQNYTFLKDAIKDALANATYDDEASTTVHVNLVNNVWTPDETDIGNLEKLLFDIDDIAG